jgi:hypothetical protein
MMNLTEHLNADLESAGDTSSETPAAAPETTATETPEQQPADNAEPATGDEEPLWNRAEFLQAHPELEPLAKQLQADYTRKTQALADQRKALEGVDPADVEWLRQFNEARIYNPALAQQMWQQASQQVLGGSAPPATPEEDPWVTDTERQLAARLERMEQQVQQQNLAGIRAEVDRQWGALEAEAKVQVPQEQRIAVLQRMASLSTPERPIPVSELPLFYRGMFGYEAARRAGIGEGERVAQQRASLGAPPSSVVNTPEVEAPRAKDLSEHLEREFGRV